MIDIPSNLTDGDSVYLGDKRFVYNGGKLVPYVVTNVGSELTSPKLNVETLTEFRHSISGKPLYKKTINFGILPNATNKFMAHGIVGAEDIRVNVDDSYAYYLQEQYPIVWTDTTATAQWRAWTDRTNVGMKTGFNATSIAAYITLLYTKTTDTAESPVRLIGGGGTGGVDSTKAPLNSPSLTGVPTAPTAAVATNNTQIATTAFVKSVVDTMIGDIASALDTINGQVI